MTHPSGETILATNMSILPVCDTAIFSTIESPFLESCQSTFEHGTGEQISLAQLDSAKMMDRPFPATKTSCVEINEITQS